MHLAIIHYHLFPGGVTQVIANHLRSLEMFLGKDCDHRIAVLHGGLPEDFQNLGWEGSTNIEVSAHVIPGLGYDNWPETPLDSEALAKNIIQELTRLNFPLSDSVIHVHNHSLGKNVSLPGALRTISDFGYSLLLQVHDFAEDFRYEQYQRLKIALDGQSHQFHQTLYPQGGNIHYAVLNGRDRQVFSDCGVSEKRLHTLPNPIVDLGTLPSRDDVRGRMNQERGIPDKQPLITYPVRCIRRKNIGELLLWAALFKHQASFGATLAPHSNVEKPSYERWKSLATELQLPCHFELAETFSFKENIAAADALITTSVAEGFGMVFLESHLMGRLLLGRKLSEITSDFENNGIDLSALYPTLAIPVDFLGRDRICKTVLAAYSEIIENFDAGDYWRGEATDALNRILATATVDFSLLTPQLQEEIIRMIVENTRFAQTILDNNPLLKKSIPLAGSQKILDHNANAVRNNYAPLSTGEKMKSIYDQIIYSSHRERADELVHAEKVLNAFLCLERFCPLRSMR